VAAAFERFVDAETFSDSQIAKLVSALQVDILVDLNGFTGAGRTGIFAMRPAPIQMNYLGYPGTLGADYMQYIIADRVVIPDSRRECYSEKIVYLPNSFMANDDGLTISDAVVTRSDLGLPPSGFVFCCFNSMYKIGPRMFDAWMHVVRSVEGSVLWLGENNPRVMQNLRNEAAARAVDPERLIFAERVPELPDHLARLRLADLFLDTLPYNAHATACHALWAGVPVLTCLGDTFAGRVAASLLDALDVPDLITTEPEAYEALAIELATQHLKLEGIRQKVANNRCTTPLFDTKLFTRHIEEAYRLVYERHREGLPPDHVCVSRP
jgi:predicted O-linked N-acetylglucosamine transferase (SPINDLY family)